MLELNERDRSDNEEPLAIGPVNCKGVLSSCDLEMEDSRVVNGIDGVEGDEMFGPKDLEIGSWEVEERACSEKIVADGEDIEALGMKTGRLLGMTTQYPPSTVM
jgi:hypothetical protein